jgi:hypothetical protein
MDRLSSRNADWYATEVVDLLQRSCMEGSFEVCGPISRACITCVSDEITAQ